MSGLTADYVASSDVDSALSTEWLESSPCRSQVSIMLHILLVVFAYEASAAAW